MILLNNQLYVTIKIDGQELIEQPSCIGSIAMTEGNGALFPTCMVNLNDTTGELTSRLNIVDGALLEITAGIDSASVATVNRQYRVFGHRAPSSTAGSTFKIGGIYDAPAYTTAAASEVYKGTSNEVLQELADKCLLYYEGPDQPTNDAQRWMNAGGSRAHFCNRVVRHGYIDPHSCMSFTLNSLGTLKYKNLFQLLDERPKFNLYYNTAPKYTDNSFVVRESRVLSGSGLVNTWQNYGSAKVIPSSSGNASVSQKVQVNTAQQYLPINSQVSATIEGLSRIEHAPLDCSNVHPMYEQALYQNLKFNALFSQKLSVLLYECSDIQLFDVGYYHQANADPMVFAEASDLYIVVGKSVYVKNGKSYAERLELIRMSVNSPGGSKLSSQDPGVLKNILIPDALMNPGSTLVEQCLSVVNVVSGIYQAVKNPVAAAQALLPTVSAQLAEVSPALSSLAQLAASGALHTSTQTTMGLIDALAAPTGSLVGVLDDLTAQYTGQSGVIASVANAAHQARVFASGSTSSLVQQQFGQLNTNALFIPGGAIDSLSVAFPALTSVSNAVRVYNTVGSVVNASNSLPQSSIGVYNDGANQINQAYLRLSQAACTTWNTCVSASTGMQPEPNATASYEVQAIAVGTIAESTQGLNVPTYKDTNNSIAGILSTVDPSGSHRFIATTDNNGIPTPLFDVSPVNITELPQHVDSMLYSNEKLLRIADENSF